MDVNNTPYFLLRSEAEFEQSSSKLSWNPTLQALTLAQNQALRLPASDATAALAAWNTSTPLALDSFNQIGRLSADKRKVEFNSGRGFLTLQDELLAEVAAPAGEFTDMAFAAVSSSGPNSYNQSAGDGRLALPYSNSVSQHGLVVFHLARRWQAHCSVPVKPLRAAVDAEKRIWLVSDQALLMCSGEPLPLPYEPLPIRFEPVTINPHELQLRFQQALPTGLHALAICADRQWVYVLCHDGAGKQCLLTRAVSDKDDLPFSRFDCEEAIPFAIDLALANDSARIAPTTHPGDHSRLAALVPRQTGDTAFVQRDCAVLSLQWDSETDTGTALLVRERYPMLSQAVPRFVASADGQLRYQAEVDPDFPQIVPRPRELHALRRPQFHLDASAVLHQVLDAGQPDVHWHRLYLDAHIPPGCEIQIAVRVYDAPAERSHAPWITQQTPVWNPIPSELGYADSLAPYKPGQGGLFEILLQRPSGPVRRISGRYLQVQVTLKGNGRLSPCLYALRVYYPRFSYQEAYLPELYRQELSYDPAYSSGPANGADTRERLLAAFEGVLTPIEGRIAAADQLVHPAATPPQNLPWLAEILGTQLPTHWPITRQRRLVADTTLIQQFKGTLNALNLALDILSDGGVQRGEIVVLENFRLRRTMATILGINMDDGEHPLTLGTGMSGNSIVGDSLILSEADARTFLALFAPDQAQTADEQATVTAFFEQYAHQVSVLLHGRGVALRQAVEEVLADQLPAHLQFQIFETQYPFVLGISPLLAVDTFIETTPEFRRVTLDDTSLGNEGVLKNPAAFAPEDINAVQI